MYHVPELAGRYLHKLKNLEDENIVLLGDIGGTNCRLMLMKINIDKSFDQLFHKVYKTNCYHHLYEAIVDFQKDYTQSLNKNYSFQIAVVSIAASVLKNNATEMANTCWPAMKGDELKKKLKLKYFVFLNDFEAMGNGLKIIPDNLISCIYEGKLGLNVAGNKALLGPGTGLGVCLISHHQIAGKDSYQIRVSEGGHTANYFNDQEEYDLYQHLCVKNQESYLCLELSSCGLAIPGIYEFFYKKKHNNLPQTMITSYDIIKKGVSRECEVCSDVVDFLLKRFGKISAEKALHFNAKGGVYIVGSIVDSLIDLMKNKDHEKNLFMKEFQSHIDACPDLSGISIYYIGDKDLYFYGLKAVGLELYLKLLKTH